MTTFRVTKGLAQLMANCLITVYWGQKAIESLLPEADLMLLGRHNEGFSSSCAIMLAQAALGAAAAIVVLWQTRARADSR